MNYSEYNSNTSKIYFRKTLLDCVAESLWIIYYPLDKHEILLFNFHDLCIHDYEEIVKEC